MSRALLAALAAFALGPAAFAQTMTLSPGTPSSTSPGVTTFSPSTQEVQLVAPQLVPFAGSSGNFESLVTGLTTGTTVTLATVGANGALQIVTFTPASSVTPGDAARLLETARQNLISQGIAAPTGTQIAAALLGGTVTSLSGTPNTLTGVLTGTVTPTTPVQVRTDAGALQTGTASSNISPAQLVAVRNALATGGGVTLMGSGGAPNVVISATGVRLSDAEVNQALQLAPPSSPRRACSIRPPTSCAWRSSAARSSARTASPSRFRACSRASCAIRAAALPASRASRH